MTENPAASPILQVGVKAADTPLGYGEEIEGENQAFDADEVMPQGLRSQRVEGHPVGDPVKREPRKWRASATDGIPVFHVREEAKQLTLPLNCASPVLGRQGHDAPRKSYRGVSQPVRRRKRLRAAVGTGILGGCLVLLGGFPLVGSGEPPAQASGHPRTYVVLPGDSLWSIVSTVHPGRDPRPLVDRLSAELRGASLQVGQTIEVP